MRGFFEPLRGEFWFETALEHVEKKEPFLVSGLVDGAKTHTAFSIASIQERPSVIVAPNEVNAREIYEDLAFYKGSDVTYFPAKDPLFYSVDSKGLAIEEKRLSLLRELTEKGIGKGTVVMSVEGLYDRLIPKELWQQYIIKKRIGDELPLEDLTKHLTIMGYERVTQIESPGQYAVRGGIVDIFPVTDDNAYRIELWGDEIDSIRLLDPDSQRSLSRLEYITVFPASEILVGGDRLTEGLKRIREEGNLGSKRLIKAGYPEEADRLKNMIDHFLERMERGKGRGLESFVTLFYEKTVNILDYLPKDTILFFMEPGRIKEKVRLLQDEIQNSLKDRLRKGYILASQTDMFPDFDEIEGTMADFSRVFLCSLLSSSQDAFYIRDILRVNTRSINVISGSISLLLDELKTDTKLNYRTVVLTDSTAKAERLKTMLGEDGLEAYLYENTEEMPAPGKIAVKRGALKQGFSYPDSSFSMISMGDLTEKSSSRRRKHKKIKGAQQISSFSDIKVGDYVVHENHGVGIYHGIVQMMDGGAKRDYFKIVYKDGGILYVPTTSLDMLQKYIAGEGQQPKLNNLSGADWQRTKRKVKEGVKKLAEDLTRLYAERKERPGFAFSEDSPWQKEFEDSFPYEETDDQISAIEETKKDMESPHIMDRLILGDVGFGKTEIAIRAAFKAVQDSKQVALLAPTTILAQQHYNTFTERMRDFDFVNVGLLSRFASPKQITKVLDGLKKGTVDIVIGTHRLLSADVVFKDLGLLIIDEEQRFGVAHKEKIKSIKKDVDVLTLTATPIPRTLHMSLSGMRDMSLLQDAPQDRHPVQTYVMEKDEQMIREAIYRELGRGGQVFYLHNRVNNIEDTTARIQQLVPEARVVMAHGQMNERELERIMLRFVDGDVDVLVCTTIIETGLDIPNANTLIVEDADGMGLAQLYQLRGRVGRSSRMAYAYFLYREGKVLSEVAEKRLEAIGELTEFGSGYKLALRDLEIRGAGNVLGPEQHGHMGAVGYDLYTKLLKEAMDQLHGEEVQESFETTVHLKVDAFLPPTYIVSEQQKLETYKRIASIRSQDDADDMIDEMIDRYGEMPRSAENLVKVSLIKALLNSMGCDLIEYEQGILMVQLRSDAPIDVLKLPEFMKQHEGNIRLQARGDHQRLLIRIEHSPKDHVLLDHILAAARELTVLKEEREEGA